jgi:hypothetical protein
MTIAVATLKSLGFDCSMAEQVSPRGVAACFDRIDQCDALFVFNPEGYVGESVAADIGYAWAKGKPLLALEPIEDPPLGDIPVLICLPPDIDPESLRVGLAAPVEASTI